MQSSPIEQKENIYSVSRLNNEVRLLLEQSYPFVWVEGEISNFSAPHSGHWYFSLKDEAAQVRCAMFKGQQRKLDFQPKDGTHVLIKARVGLYPNRGEYQLIADHMEERGEGKLQRAFLLLKKKLELAGLFNAEHKKTLPAFPKRIGIVTSATGAAVRDILNVLKRRYPCAAVVIYPTLVQGAQAAPTIVRAIQLANERAECDVVILTRGGGSLEDLWPFNEEMVAEAIFASKLPIISGVGHEVDFTIADFVADVRAPTPSAAAEIATPDRMELLEVIKHHKRNIWRLTKSKLALTKERITFADKHLAQQHPKRKLEERMQHLDKCEAMLMQLQTRLFTKLRVQMMNTEARLQQQLPSKRIQEMKHQLNFSAQKQEHLVLKKINQYKNDVLTFITKLEAFSPLATLKRGYAIAKTPQHKVLQKVEDTYVGAHIHIQLSDGELECAVERIVATP